jgi:hypothetical protein
MKVSFEGIGDQFVTFYAADGTKAGQPVKISANGTVATCTETERFAGVAVHITEDGFATVQTKGYVTLTYSGDTAPVIGFGKLIADGTGGVKTDSNGGEFLIAEVDAIGKTVGFFM